MNAADYAAEIRRSRRVGALLCAAGAGCAVIAWSTAAQVAWGATYGALLAGALLVLFGLIALSTRPGELCLVFDRNVPRSSPSGECSASITLAEWVALDKLAEDIGAPKLGRFVAGSLKLGAAEHAVPLGVECISALLEADRLSAAQREYLRWIRARLLEADAAGARFCLLPAESWTGLIETNLRLHLG